MRVGIVVSLPSDVERFVPVLRRLSGADFVLPAARWPHPRIDTRRWTLESVLRHGSRPLEEPDESFDLLLVAQNLSARLLRPWLSPRGRVVLWGGETGFSRLSPGERGVSVSDREGSVAMTPSSFDVAFSCAAHEAWLPPARGWPELVLGDPRAEGFFDVGAAARARAYLGLETESRRSRPVLLLLRERADGAIERWARRLCALRADFDLVVAPSERLRLDPEAIHPRALTGPGIRLHQGEKGGRLADLLAAADVVLAEPGARARLAHELGRPTWLLLDDPSDLRRRPDQEPSPLQRAMEGLPAVRDPDRLEEALGDPEVAMEGTAMQRERHRHAAAQLADRLTAATQLLLS